MDRSSLVSKPLQVLCGKFRGSGEKRKQWVRCSSHPGATPTFRDFSFCCCISRLGHHPHQGAHTYCTHAVRRSSVPSLLVAKTRCLVAGVKRCSDRTVEALAPAVMPRENKRWGMEAALGACQYFATD